MYDQIFKVTFIDEEEFIGGTLEAPKWNKCPDKGIVSLETNLPFADKITLSGYVKYNFFIGIIKTLNNGMTTINHMYVLGCNEKNMVTSYRITLVGGDTSKYKVGDMTVRQFPFGQEGMGKTATSGWKKGIEV